MGKLSMSSRFEPNTVIRAWLSTTLRIPPGSITNFLGAPGLCAGHALQKERMVLPDGKYYVVENGVKLFPVYLCYDCKYDYGKELEITQIEDVSCPL